MDDPRLGGSLLFLVDVSMIWLLDLDCFVIFGRGIGPGQLMGSMGEKGADIGSVPTLVGWYWKIVFAVEA